MSEAPLGAVMWKKRANRCVRFHIKVLFSSFMVSLKVVWFYLGVLMTVFVLHSDHKVSSRRETPLKWEKLLLTLTSWSSVRNPFATSNVNNPTSNKVRGENTSDGGNENSLMYRLCLGIVTFSRCTAFLSSRCALVLKRLIVTNTNNKKAFFVFFSSLHDSRTRKQFFWLLERDRRCWSLSRKQRRNKKTTKKLDSSDVN